MIFAVFDPDRIQWGEILFRGQNAAFWLNRIFKKIRFQSLENPEMDFDWLIIFDGSKFPAIMPKEINRLFRFLDTRKNREPIFTLRGFPFFVVSPVAMVNFKLEIEKGIYRRVAEGKSTVIESLPHIPVWDIPTHLQEIENFIVGYQISQLRDNGVVLEDYRNFFIDGQVKIGRGSRIGPGVVIRGDSEIGKNVHIYSHSHIENTTIEDDCVVLPVSVLRDSHLEKNTQVGPYTHLRNGAVIRRGAKAGNFVEMKKSILGKGSKSMHLSYIGDAFIGENVNIGAGTITCNYDGREKHVTRIEDNVFIGSGTELIAPIRIGKNSVVGAGSTLDKDVPPDSLAIARERQINKPGRGRKKKKE